MAKNTNPVDAASAPSRWTIAAIRRWPESAIYAAAISVMAFVAGLLGSIWTDDIKNAWRINGIWHGYKLPDDRMATICVLEPSGIVGRSLFLPQKVKKREN